MMYVCLWSPDWSTGGASVAEGPAGPTPLAVGLLLADRAPRLRVEGEVIWADARGLDAGALAMTLVDGLAREGVAVRAGVAAIPVVAELAARWASPDGPGSTMTPFLVKERTGWGWRRRPSVGANGSVSAPAPGPSRGGSGPVLEPDVDAGPVVMVEPGTEREWLGGLPVTALAPDVRLRALLDGVGVRTIGELASLEREAVEVRFGADAVDLWRLARCDDRRPLFLPVPPERPHGSIDFVDYVLTDPARLLFTANALLGPLCDRLTGRGEHARVLRLALPLANGEEWERAIRPARPTASREVWLRLIRGLLDRLTVPDAVTGMRLEVVATEPAAVRQGDLFDRGFATASAVEAAIARLAERQVVPVVPEVSGHPLVERSGFELRASNFELPTSNRSEAEVAEGNFEPRKAERGGNWSESGEGGEGGEGGVGGQGLALQLLAEPCRLLVETVRRRDHDAPVRLRDRGAWREVVLAAGPDRVSGGRWEAEPYAREYYRCVTDEGVPLWLYRDGRDNGWYLHGWWD